MEEEERPSSVPEAIIQLSHREGCSGLRLLFPFVVQEQAMPLWEADTISYRWAPGYRALALQINKLSLGARGFL